MKRTLLFFLTLLAASAAMPVAAAEAAPPKELERLVQEYESPERWEWQKPHTLARLLGLGPGDRVADLGAGTGFLVPYLSSLVTRSGKVYAVEIEPALLEYIRARKDVGLNNVVTVLATPSDPKLPEGELDCVLLLNTWHEIKNRTAYLRRLAPSLRPGGRVVVVDFHEGVLPVGPPPKGKLSREKALAEFERAGWSLLAESTAFPYQYCLTFAPPAS
jgi:ubiquinone/menaquinone biosynthesis C-methylase UbiE